MLSWKGPHCLFVNWYFLYLMQFSLSNSVMFESYFAHLPKDSSQLPGTHTQNRKWRQLGRGIWIAWAQTTSSTITHIPSFATSKKRRGKTCHPILALNSKPESWPARQCDSAGSAAISVTLQRSCACTSLATGTAHYPTSRLQPTTFNWTQTPQEKRYNLPIIPLVKVTLSKAASPLEKPAPD